MSSNNSTQDFPAVLFSDRFLESAKRYKSLEKSLKKKIDAICEHPIELGEPLKGNWRGYYSCPVKKGFLVIYTFCRSCRKKKDNEVVQCADCESQLDDSIRFWHFGPHDKVYSDGPP